MTELKSKKIGQDWLGIWGRLAAITAVNFERGGLYLPRDTE